MKWGLWVSREWGSIFVNFLVNFAYIQLIIFIFHLVQFQFFLLHHAFVFCSVCFLTPCVWFYNWDVNKSSYYFLMTCWFTIENSNWCLMSDLETRESIKIHSPTQTGVVCDSKQTCFTSWNVISYSSSPFSSSFFFIYLFFDEKPLINLFISMRNLS